MGYLHEQKADQILRRRADRPNRRLLRRKAKEEKLPALRKIRIAVDFWLA
jgi:hypothetical protein